MRPYGTNFRSKKKRKTTGNGRKKTLKDGSTPEATIQAQILSWLRQSKLLFWRQNSGKMFIGFRRIVLGEEGLPDIIVIVPPTGRLLGLEVKSARGKQRPSQIVFQKRMEAVGATYKVVRSLEQAMDAVAEMLGDRLQWNQSQQSELTKEQYLRNLAAYRLLKLPPPSTDSLT